MLPCLHFPWLIENWQPLPRQTAPHDQSQNRQSSHVKLSHHRGRPKAWSRLWRERAEQQTHARRRQRTGSIWSNRDSDRRVARPPNGQMVAKYIAGSEATEGHPPHGRAKPQDSITSARQMWLTTAYEWRTGLEKRAGIGHRYRLSAVRTPRWPRVLNGDFFPFFFLTSATQKRSHGSFCDLSKSPTA
jgi:hypothetical protein